MALFLLADDEKQIEQILRFKLTKEGHNLDYVMNGEEAYKKTQDISITYDVIILDVMMPDFDGIYALQKIREIERYKSTPIIMLTGKSSEDDISKGLQLGATEYITKPFSPSQIIEKLKKYVN